MQALTPLTTPAGSTTKKMLWAGYVLSLLPALLLLFSAFMKLSKNPQAVEGFKKYGYQDGAIFSIGVLEVLCTLIYLIPRTSVLGAILLTGYMGGAIVTHLRAGEPFVVQMLVGVIIWIGLFLRDSRLRALLPLRT